MKVSKIAGLRVLVLGLGLHGGGVSVARWLVAHGARVTISDLKNNKELAPSLKKLNGLGVRLVLGGHPRTLLKTCDLIIQNPGVPKELPFLKWAKKKNIPIENEASLFLKLCPSLKIIGVTGSKGKSTTTSLLGQLLKFWDKRTIVAGNIRDTVMFDTLDKLTLNTPLVLELSSWHLELVGKYRQHLPIAVVTNIYQEHLNRYNSLTSYVSAKANIFRYQKANEVVILNYDNKITRAFGQSAPGKVYWFSIKNKVPRGIFIKQGNVYLRDKKRLIKLFVLSQVTLSGEHNLSNLLGAIVAAYVYGMPIVKLKQVIRKLKPLHDRIELVRKVRGVFYYNDTTATAPIATQVALRALSHQNIILIAGGADKNLDYSELAREVQQRVKALILLPGTATVKMQIKLKKFTKQFLTRNMNEAVKLAAKVAPLGSAVLLSPGAASFGLFKHEFDRGKQFIRVVKKL